MPGMIIDGRIEQVGPGLAGLTIVNYLEEPKLKLRPGHSMRARHTRWVRSIVVHNTKNIEVTVLPGSGPFCNVGERVAKFWSTNPKPAGAHLAIDWDGTICCLADLLQDATYHAGSMNEVSIGIEIFEDGKGQIYEVQLAVLMALLRWLCTRFRIQMQVQSTSYHGQIDRILAGGKDCVGIFGHCHQCWKDKGHDPGKFVLQHIASCGFQAFDFQKGEDKAYWKSIQRALGLSEDGTPGPDTCDALQAIGFTNGLYDYSTVI